MLHQQQPQQQRGGVAGGNHQINTVTTTEGTNRFSMHTAHHHHQFSEDEKEKIEKWKDNLEHENNICPISHVLMIDPVVLADSGITYERASIEKWLEKNKTCPITKKQLKTTTNVNQLIPNYSTKNLIEQSKEKYCCKLIALLEQKLEERKGLNDCLELIDNDLLIYVDKKEKRTQWEKIMLIKLRIMTIKRDLELSGNNNQAQLLVEEWFKKLERELLELTKLTFDGSTTTTTTTTGSYSSCSGGSFDTHQFKTVKKLLDQLSTKFDTTHSHEYEKISKRLDDENRKREEFEYRYKMKQLQKAKEMEERRVRREREASLQMAANVQSQQQQANINNEEISTTQWLAMGAGILGAGALVAVGLFSAFSSSSRDDRRK